MRGFSGVLGCGLGTPGQDRLGDLDAVERVDVDAGALEKGEGGNMLEGSSSLIRMMGCERKWLAYLCGVGLAAVGLALALATEGGNGAGEPKDVGEAA